MFLPSCCCQMIVGIREQWLRILKFSRRPEHGDSQTAQVSHDGFYLRDVFRSIEVDHAVLNWGPGDQHLDVSFAAKRCERFKGLPRWGIFDAP